MTITLVLLLFPDPDVPSEVIFSGEQPVEDEQPYIDLMLRESESMPPYPEDAATHVLDFLLLGDMHKATDPVFLKENRITHVISCIGDCSLDATALYKQMGIEYLSFEAMDSIWYDIMQHFDSVHKFIETGRQSGGKVFIHCKQGVNRSGALAVAYYMAHKKIGPITAVRDIREKRKRVLANEEFQRQLIVLANSRRLLRLDKDKIAPDSVSILHSS